MAFENTHRVGHVAGTLPLVLARLFSMKHMLREIKPKVLKNKQKNVAALESPGSHSGQYFAVYIDAVYQINFNTSCFGFSLFGVATARKSSP